MARLTENAPPFTAEEAQRLPPEHLSAMVLALFDGLFIQWFLDPVGVPEEIFVSLKRSVFALVMPDRPLS